MANRPVVSWSETTPQGSEARSLGDNRIRELKTQIRQVVDTDHKFSSSGQDTDFGYHTQLHLMEQADLGSGIEAIPLLGAQTMDGKAELVFTDENDNDHQFTKATKKLLTNGVILNNEFLQSRDAGDTAYHNTIGINASNDLVLGSAVYRPTAGAGYIPSAPLNLATKSYVDAFGSINVQTGAVSTGTTVMPDDDTIPQITEGDEYMTLAVTPTKATNKLKIEVVIYLTSNANDTQVVALFQDATAGALAAVAEMAGANERQTISLSHFMTAGTVAETTFRVRSGNASSNTTTFNGAGGGRNFGGVAASSITITEIGV